MSESGQITSILLHLRPVVASNLPRSHGYWAFLAAMELFMHLEPRLAHDIHEADGRKPFTVSPLLGVVAQPTSKEVALQPDQSYRWRLTGLNTQMSALLNRLVQNKPVQGVRIQQTVFTLEEATLQKSTTYQALQESLAQNEPLTASLQFTTPTAFRLGTFEQPFPLPQWVFGSLRDAWNTHSGLPLENFDPNQISLTRWEGKTHRIDLGPKLGGTVGFTGNFRYQAFPKSKVSPGQLALLCAYAEFAGVGWLTTNGMGQVTPEILRPG